MASNGKGVACGNHYSRKRKQGNSGDGEKSGGALKSKNRSVHQFFEDNADDIDVYWTDDSDSDHDWVPSIEPNVQNDMGKGQSLLLLPKPEEIEEQELSKMMEPITWKVKCMVGCERLLVFCLMQKFVALNDLGIKLQIVSAFVVEHIKGFVFIEAEKHIDVIEACKGIDNIYVGHIASVPITDVSYYLPVQNKCPEISEGMWARVNCGRKHKGDLAKIVCVNDDRKSARVKLIPRIDPKAMAEDDDGGGIFSQSISDLISQARTSFRKEFDEVEEVFVSRELRLRTELENKKKENELLRGKLELLRNEKASIETKLKEVKEKAGELLNLLDQNETRPE